MSFDTGTNTQYCAYWQLLVADSSFWVSSVLTHLAVFINVVFRSWNKISLTALTITKSKFVGICHKGVRSPVMSFDTRTNTQYCAYWQHLVTDSSFWVSSVLTHLAVFINVVSSNFVTIWEDILISCPKLLNR